ncbi:Beta-cyclopiazonate dehydrogenase [Paramyrothecium foliicola]|nr:Beta-cyclopiazonate dehydrogenase [Paramyrothecium foliicola]
MKDQAPFTVQENRFLQALLSYSGRDALQQHHARRSALAQGAAAASLRCCNTTLSRDVVVVGGGAAGAHAAVWLRDHGVSVVVVEKADQLGGHTDFYRDPETGKTINVGVQAWMEYRDTFDFPARMNVSTNGSMQFTTLDYNYLDFKTGQPVDGWTAPAPNDMYPALQRYLDAITPYEDMVLPGFFEFPDPETIPEDLLMPFGEFVEKYNLEAAVPQIWDSTAMGLGDTMHVPTLWVVQASGIPMVRALLGIGAAATPASGRLYDLFERIAEFLGSDVLYSSTVVSALRQEGDKGVVLKVRGADEKVTCVEAKRLLIAMEPTMENMQPFRLDKTEETVFEKFKYATVYAGILQHPSLQVGSAYSNRSPAPGSTNYTVFPTASQVGRIDYIGGTKDLFQFTAVGTEKDTTETMQALIAETIDTLIEAGTIPASNGTVSFAAFANHGKMHPHVTADDLRSGFVQKQLALQGHRSTWYTGAAFSAGFTTVLWEYNNVLLPSMIAGL